MKVILWIALIGLAVLVTALVVSLYYQRKYDSISRQLSELQIDKDSVEPDQTKASEGADDELFRQLTDAIRKEQLYTMPKFGRAELVERFHLSSKRVSTAFSMAGTSVPEFIRECRLEHARRLIAERPDMPLVEIATASGFVHASTFTVDFKNKYGLSPTKYREKKLKGKDPCY